MPPQVAVMDWWSRYVLGWELSNSLEAEFCVRAWAAALGAGRPKKRRGGRDGFGHQFLLSK
jgi:transposase InsO family protein